MATHLLGAGLVSVLALGATLASPAWADISISNKATANMSCEAGVCTATAQKAVLNTGDLQTMLASGDLTVKTGGLAKDIDIDQPLTWSSTSPLTLDAQQSVAVNKAVSVTGTGALTIITNDGGSGGDVYFTGKGSASFADTNSSLIINGQSFTLVQDITTLAGDIAANPSGLYALANTYDAKHDRFDTVPVPTSFAGTFEGLGQRVLNIKINHRTPDDNEGFFARVLSTGTVRDLT